MPSEGGRIAASNVSPSFASTRARLAARAAAAWGFALDASLDRRFDRPRLVAVIGGHDIAVGVAVIAALRAVAAIVAVAAVGARLLLTIAAVGTRILAVFLAAILTIIVAIGAIVARLLVAAGLGVGDGVVAVLVEALIVVVERILAAAALALVRVLFVEAAAAFGEDAEIVIRELQIIFGVDAVALALRVGRERLVLLEQLSGIAACAIIDAVAVPGIGISATLALSTPTATAAGLTIIIDQSPVVLVYETNPALLQPGANPRIQRMLTNTRRPRAAKIEWLRREDLSRPPDKRPDDEGVGTICDFNAVAVDIVCPCPLNSGYRAFFQAEI